MVGTAQHIWMWQDMILAWHGTTRQVLMGIGHNTGSKVDGHDTKFVLTRYSLSWTRDMKTSYLDVQFQLHYYQRSIKFYIMIS